MTTLMTSLMTTGSNLSIASTLDRRGKCPPTAF
ncbi:hypothetical protein Pla52o_43690 [Novipirellula galeiformis]|uniref:Uncharacterized protein n=1 Tax=Novipirellula galeiformis TaxID=2528004 RepID=A0A5C6CAI5_9BACT|nr:hypothetical protein Pla52o_43690 [Novipirellula galeiformis]